MLSTGSGVEYVFGWMSLCCLSHVCVNKLSIRYKTPVYGNAVTTKLRSFYRLRYSFIVGISFELRNSMLSSIHVILR